MSPLQFASLVMAWLVSTSVVLLWVHLSKQQVVPRSWPRYRMIAIRTGLLFTLSALGLVGVLGCSPSYVATAATFVVLLVPGISLGALEAAGSAGSLGILFLFVVPLFALRQYILGNPELDDIFPKPPSGARPEKAAINSPDEGGLVTAVTALRPAGFVAVAGQRTEARSHDGGFIELGSRVQVCGRQNRQLLVRRLPPNGAVPSDSASSVSETLSNFDGQPNSAASNDP